MSTVIVNHIDLDAVGCKVILDYYNFKYDFMICLNYSDVESNRSEIEKYDNIICTDFSLPINFVKELLDKGKKVEIYDHHDYKNDEERNGLLDLKHENYKIVHDIEMCGTSIVAREFKPRIRTTKALAKFISLVETYDLYKKDSELWEDAQNCNRVLWKNVTYYYKDSRKFDRICKSWLYKLRNFNEWQWSKFEVADIEDAIKIEDQTYSEASLTLRKKTDEKGNIYGMAVAAKKISIVASRLLDANVDLKYIIVFNTYGGIWGKLSIRSPDSVDFDCTQFEECGGHVHASGGEITEERAKNIYAGKDHLIYKE